MDKETLSNYGWIVILILILSVLLALATPFGNFIAGAFKATYAGFGMVGDNALGIVIPGSSIEKPEIPDQDDSLKNAYALILDNSSDSSNSTPMIFVRENEAPIVGEVYESETYGALPITAVYSDIETTKYASASFVPWYSDGNYVNVSAVTFEDQISPVSTAYWFYDMSNCLSMDVIKLNTSSVVSMNCMFRGCSGLTSLNVSHFVTDNVTQMQCVFYNCSGITTLNLSMWNTAKVISMNGMFHGCAEITYLDVSNFVTDNVTSMYDMFWGCSKLTELNMSSWNTSNVTNMGCMFTSCSSLTTLDMSGWNTQNVTSMSSMFQSCSRLTSLNVSHFITDNVTNMHSMFYGCSGVNVFNVSSWNTTNVTDMAQMFQECSTITTLDISSFNTINVGYMGFMFKDCSNLTTIYASEQWSVANVSDGDRMFGSCSKLVGGNGTKYSFFYTGLNRAVLDAEGTSGYLTYKPMS